MGKQIKFIAIRWVRVLGQMGVGRVEGGLGVGVGEITVQVGDRAAALQQEDKSNMKKQGRILNKKKLKPSPLMLESLAFRDQVGMIQVQLFDLGLEEKSKTETLSISFHFDLKFSFSMKPPFIKFERYESTVKYELENEQEVLRWRRVLQDRLNQRGFHEQFTPIKKIGKGNFASVYLVEKVEDGKSYAVKAFSKEAAYSQEKGQECLIKEIEIMRSLSHKNCMKLHEVFESENSLYMVLGLLEGGQLYDRIKSKYKFKPAEVVMTMRGILLGLETMHCHKIMHRDLKPQNLLYPKKGDWNCVIADFGLSEFVDEEEYLFLRCGTPGYVAPEVINIKDTCTKYTTACDMFSLGLIFYLLLSGKSAFTGKTYYEVLKQNRAAYVNLDIPELKDAPLEAIDLLKKLLVKQPEKRITAQAALKHPYIMNCQYSGTDEEDDGIPVSTVPCYSIECDSPLLTSANPKRTEVKNLKKDSCVEFKMGKDNIITGTIDSPVRTARGRRVPKETEILKSKENCETAVRPKVSQFSTKRSE